MIGLWSLTLADLSAIAVVVVAINGFMFWSLGNWMRLTAEQEARRVHSEGNLVIEQEIRTLALNQESQGMMLVKVHELERVLSNGLTEDVAELRNEVREIRRLLMR